MISKIKMFTDAIFWYQLECIKDNNIIKYLACLIDGEITIFK